MVHGTERPPKASRFSEDVCVVGVPRGLAPGDLDGADDDAGRKRSRLHAVDGG